MKTFITLLIIAVVGWAGWYMWSNNHGSGVALTTESPSATQASYGQGGQAPEPSDYVDVSQTSAPVVTATPVRTATPRPAATRTPTPTPAPVLAFRTVSGINGFDEHGTMVITSTTDGRAEISFNVVGTPAGVQQPAYIYRGASCQASQEVVFGINPLMNGSSMTILPIKASDLISGQGSLWLVIHMSADNSTRVSCAAIR